MTLIPESMPIDQIRILNRNEWQIDFQFSIKNKKYAIFSSLDIYVDYMNFHISIWVY